MGLPRGHMLQSWPGLAHLQEVQPSAGVAADDFQGLVTGPSSFPSGPVQGQGQTLLLQGKAGEQLEEESVLGLHQAEQFYGPASICHAQEGVASHLTVTPEERT